MTNTILQTKLFIPRLRHGHVARPHLVAQLNAGLWTDDIFARRLSLISAPAGFGKTTLVADWLQQLSLATAWLSLDPDDNEPERFLRYLAASLKNGGVEWEQNLADREPLAELINHLAAASPLLLVLNDYHLITNTLIHQHLAFFLEHAPLSCHLVIITRADPPLPLSRLRAQGEINEIRAQDLMFSTEEAAIFLNQRHQLNLPSADLLTLTTRTEGWIAGLQLAALSLQQLHTNDRHLFITNFAGEDRFILDYLLSEVLQKQSDARQKFLLRTSLLEELNADLCAAVTGFPSADMQAMLQKLEEENLFLIALDNRRETYRYHHLFADLLRSRIIKQTPEIVAIVHQRAGEWFAAHDRLDMAIQHNLAAGNPEQAANLLTSEMLLRHATPGQILGWLAQLPDAVLANQPQLAIRQLWVLLESGQLKEVEARLLLLADKVATDAELAQELLVIRIHLARHQKDSKQAIALSQELLAQLPTPPTPVTLARQLAAVFGLAEAYRLAGELDAAQIQFVEAGRLSEMIGNPTYVWRAQLGEAQVQAEQGAWEAAVPTLQKLTSLAATFPQEAALAHTLLAQMPTTAKVMAGTSPDLLTERELNVLRWLDSDLTMAEIGEQLFISANTVKTHLKRIYAKLGARGRHEAVAIAKENDLLQS